MNTTMSGIAAVILGVLALLPDSNLAFARGGAPNLMDSPGYQRRLQESRQQLQVQPAPVRPVVHHKKRHKRSH